MIVSLAPPRIIAESSTGCIFAGSSLGKKGERFLQFGWNCCHTFHLVLPCFCHQLETKWRYFSHRKQWKWIIATNSCKFGNKISVLLEFDFIWFYGVCYPSGVYADKVGIEAAEMLLKNIRHNGCVDEFLQDQVRNMPQSSYDMSNKTL